MSERKIKLISGNVKVRAGTAKFLGSCFRIGQIQYRTGIRRWYKVETVFVSAR